MDVTYAITIVFPKFLVPSGSFRERLRSGRDPAAGNPQRRGPRPDPASCHSPVSTTLQVPVSCRQCWCQWEWQRGRGGEKWQSPTLTLPPGHHHQWHSGIFAGFTFL